MEHIIKLSRRSKLLLLLILAVTFAFPLSVNAAKLYCRSDPIVILSNGVIMDLSADISTLAWNVKEVHYELHAPVGTRVLVVIPTRTWLTSQETFTFFADQDAGDYMTVTTVHTTEGDATVVANTLLVSPLGIRLGARAVGGFEGFPIITRLFR